MKIVVGFILALFAFLMPSLVSEDKITVDLDSSVNSVLESLGENLDHKKPKLELKNVSAEIGEDLVKHGFSKRKGLKKSKRQSKHFVCTSCHNVDREDPDLSISDPQARLEYTASKGMPFLQGTTLYGAVNRDSFYNGYYVKKYEDLVKPAQDNIREAIQLCATECAQGRKLKEWEMESILAYLWELELKLSDLNLSKEELSQLQLAIDDNAARNRAVSMIKSKYLNASPAKDVLPPENRKEGYGLTGDADNGKLIYDNSCLHCHYNMKYSYFQLDHERLTYKYMNRKASKFSNHSIYQVIRYGTFPKYGKKSYMPLYTQEKMSDQQVEDLRAYFKAQSS